MKAKSALTVALAAGIASTAAASNTPTTLSANNGKVVQVAHIYYNVASGEKIITLIGDGQTAGAQDDDSGPVWAAVNGNTCSEEGYTTSYFFGIDDNSDTSLGGPATSLSTNITNLDYGDIAIDTLVDCLHFSWVTDHIDVDADTDGIGDGVVGLSGEWTIFDCDNGRELDRSTRLPIISILLTDLPGDISGTNDPDDPANTFAGYTLDLDLTASSLTSNLMFEIGDSDGDLQGAAFGNNDVDINSDGIGDGFSIADSSIDPATGFPFVDRNFDGLADADLDGDTYFDWSWGLRFYQPGTGDSNGDGVIDALDGDIADSHRLIGVGFGAPEGTATSPDGGVTWAWEIDPAIQGAGFGSEDRFAQYFPPNGAGDIVYEGGYFFGGFACAGVNYTPYSSFEFGLYGPVENPCVADMNGDGVLNFFDISAFLGFFSAGDLTADINGDGVLNFFDISAFLGLFAAGCP
ncbi:MAG: hypothetical protein JKY95_00295 [Planctomycetaceae bacterium]|nr:hypothetical protein [Planctomycetaceae bacterium]